MVEDLVQLPRDFSARQQHGLIIGTLEVEVDAWVLRTGRFTSTRRSLFPFEETCFGLEFQY
jgi:hypothetical protein